MGKNMLKQIGLHWIVCCLDTIRQKVVFQTFPQSSSVLLLCQNPPNMENFWQIAHSQILLLFSHLRNLIWVYVLFTQVSDCQCISSFCTLFDYTGSWKNSEWVERIWHNLSSLDMKIKEKQKILGKL